MNGTDWQYQPPVSARAPSTRWTRVGDAIDRALTATDTWLCAAAAALGRSVLDSFADYGCCYCGRPLARFKPARWQEEALDRLLDVPPCSDRH